jgi:hypothetical protein
LKTSQLLLGLVSILPLYNKMTEENEIDANFNFDLPEDYDFDPNFTFDLPERALINIFSYLPIDVYHADISTNS